MPTAMAVMMSGCIQKRDRTPRGMGALTCSGNNTHARTHTEECSNTVVGASAYKIRKNDTRKRPLRRLQKAVDTHRQVGEGVEHVHIQQPRQHQGGARVRQQGAQDGRGPRQDATATHRDRKPADDRKVNEQACDSDEVSRAQRK